MSAAALPEATPVRRPPRGQGADLRRLFGGVAAVGACALALLAAGCAAEEGAPDAAAAAGAPAAGGAEDSGLELQGGAPEADTGGGAMERPDEGAGDSAAAGRAPELQVAELRWADEGGDGVWSPGEVLWLEARLVNAGVEPYDHGPGLQISSPSGWVTLPEPERSTWGLGAGESVELRFWAVASPGAPPGELVPFEVLVIATGCGGDVPCPDPAPLRFEVPIGA